MTKTNTYDFRITGAAFLMLVLLLILPGLASAQGLPLDGYTLFNPNNSRTTYLVDMEGHTVHTWNHQRSGGYSVYLLPNGNLLRPAVTSTPSLRGGASAGLIQEVDWDGNVVWEYDYAGSTYVAHHDLEPMPNGNILAIAWEVKSAAEATAQGRVNAREMWPDHIVEIKPEGKSGGTIVWEWHAWDHLVQDRDASKPNYGVVAEHPELMNINLGGSTGGPGGGDWLHVNGISYNPERDEIAITSHFMDEIYIIDHSTTTEEAAGHTGGRHGKGGDFIYRWGKPQNYGAPGAQYFEVVHCPFWIPEGYPGAGNLLAFNNNTDNRASIIAEITPPVDAEGKYILQAGQSYGPVAPTWEYSNGTVFYSNHLGGTQRLSNGNTFITEATSGYFFEVDSEGNEVWSYNHGRQVARSLRYPRSYSGLAALHGTDVQTDEAPLPELAVRSYPNPFTDYAVLICTISGTAGTRLSIYDVLGKEVRVLDVSAEGTGSSQAVWDGRNAAGQQMNPGLYFYVLRSGTQSVSGTMIMAGR